MAQFSFAIVRPRVISPHSGEVRLLEDVVADHLSAGDHAVVEILGGPLTGKTTAIEYLQQFFSDERKLTFVDAPVGWNHSLTPAGRITVATSPPQSMRDLLGRYRLAPWGQDEWIEYLLAAHKSRCGSVMGRLRATPQFGFSLGGNPCLWRLVLDELAANDSTSSAAESLHRVVGQLFPSGPENSSLRTFALVAAAPLAIEIDEERLTKQQDAMEQPLPRLLALEPVRTILAAEAILLHLKADREPSHLQRPLPYSLIREVSATVKLDESLQSRLREVLAAGNISLHAMAASVLHAAEIEWKPTRLSAAVMWTSTDQLNKLPDLCRAYLPDAKWTGIDLRDARLTNVNLQGAILEHANLDGARLDFATVIDANLRGASLARVNARCAGFSGADLSFARAPKAILRADLSGANLEGALLTEALFTGANLTKASFVRANLSQAELFGADITDADFTQANLHRSRLDFLVLRLACFQFAIFSKACLHECNLEGMELSGADFQGADLRGALLTGSVMIRANLRGADLRRAGLADVEWEGVDLRDADLRQATFHLGSTRSGLVGSPYPSHGTRTGFYTDDYNEQDFKSPEEIRKANLCGADLRGANMEDVDFYLVDVRDARYDHKQEMHLRRCGAILKARAV
jgi:uncharacterized protein YjbI with pentapeptide repeats